MAHRLRPARPRRRNFLRLSIPVIALPLLGLLVLIQAASLRSPLSEAEAPLAIAVRYPTRDLATATPDRASAAATAVARAGSSFLGTTEFRLRALGVVVGCAALGLLVWLGERLFSTRAGVLAALILILTQAGRALLGTEFGIEPFYLLVSLMALGAIRNLSFDRSSLVRAGVAGGAAIAFVGPSAMWIPAMAVAWLRRLRGLTLKSFAIAIGTTIASGAVLAFASAAVLGIAPLPSWHALPAPVDSLRVFGRTCLQLVPVLPLIALGLANVPPRWRRQGSPNFLWIWTTLAAAALLLFDAFAPLWVALAMVLGVVSSWALARASRNQVATALAACAALGFVLGSFSPGGATFDLDRWAVRETGKFVRRNLDREASVAATDGVRGRLAYYATRPIQRLDPTACDRSAWDYVVVDRRDVLDQTAPDARLPRELQFRGLHLHVVAEFGTWMLARVLPA